MPCPALLHAGLRNFDRMLRILNSAGTSKDGDFTASLGTSFSPELFLLQRFFFLTSNLFFSSCNMWLWPLALSLCTSEKRLFLLYHALQWETAISFLALFSDLIYELYKKVPPGVVHAPVSQQSQCSSVGLSPVCQCLACSIGPKTGQCSRCVPASVE